METTAVRQGGDWKINGMKRFNTSMHTATVDLVFARTSGKEGDARGISAFLVPVKSPGFKVEYMWWTFNMPSDHAEVSLTNVTVPGSTMLGEEGRGLDVAQTFVHENRIRQAASSVGAAQYCIDMSVAYARNRKVFGKPLATNQAIQFPLAELHTEAEMTRGLVRKTAWNLDRQHHMQVSEWVAMSNYRANRLVCDAPTAPCRSMAALAIRATPRSSISTATTAATASPKARRRSRSAASPARCSACGVSRRRRRRLNERWRPSREPVYGRRFDVRHGHVDGVELPLRQGRARRHEPAALQQLPLFDREPVPVRHDDADAAASWSAAARLAGHARPVADRRGAVPGLLGLAMARSAPSSARSS